MFEKLLAKIGYTKITNDSKKQKATWSKEAKRKVKQRNYYKKHRLDLIQKAHQLNLPILHTDDCPACNRNSALTMDEYIAQHRLICQKMAVQAIVDKVNKQKVTKQLEVQKAKQDSAIQVDDEPLVPKRYMSDRPHHDVEQRPKLSGGFVQDYLG